jgi:hypothetical protein
MAKSYLNSYGDTDPRSPYKKNEYGAHPKYSSPQSAEPFRAAGSKTGKNVAGQGGIKRNLGSVVEGRADSGGGSDGRAKRLPRK